MKFLFHNQEEKQIAEIPIIKIRPNKSQPRTIFNQNSLNQLAQSIKESGVLQPLTIRQISQTEYELICGERRLRASVMAGLKKVPCVIVKCSDKSSATYALLENLQRSDLEFFEEARGISMLIKKYGYTKEDLCLKIGKSENVIEDKLKLLNLTYDEQEWIINAGLSERHARALIRITDLRKRKEALSRIIAQNLNIQETEKLVSMMLSNSYKKSKPKGVSKAVIKDIRIFVNSINKAINTMQLAGIDAEANKRENNDFIEYTIKIYKKQKSDEKSA